jgi:hypothetical protein
MLGMLGARASFSKQSYVLHYNQQPGYTNEPRLQDAYEDTQQDSKPASPVKPVHSTKEAKKDSAVRKGVKRSSPELEDGPRKRSKWSPQREEKSKPPKKSADAKQGNKHSRLSPQSDKKNQIPKEATEAKRGNKRPSPTQGEQLAGAAKRQKTRPSPESAIDSSPIASKQNAAATHSGSDLSEAPSEVEPPPSKSQKAVTPKNTSTKATGTSSQQELKKPISKEKTRPEEAEVSEAEIVLNQSNGAKASPSGSKIAAKADAAEDSSELSSLVDEPAPKKRVKKSMDTSKSKKMSKKSTKASKAPPTDLPPDEAEIKRLQSWLVKCGIRKLWHRELAKYTTNASKIAHLKAMLKAVGMEGRFSLEKARAIKERRELEEDLEAVKEGEKRWGQNSDSRDEDEGDGDEKPKEDVSEQPPKRKLAPGLEGLEEFLNDDDGEETD